MKLMDCLLEMAQQLGGATPDGVAGFVASSAASGLIGDVAGSAFQMFLKKFKEKFVCKEYFSEEDDAEYFLKKTMKKSCESTTDAREKIEDLYKSQTDAENATAFGDAFLEWLKEHYDEFMCKEQSNVNLGSVYIGNQTINSGDHSKAQIITGNIVNITN